MGLGLHHEHAEAITAKNAKDYGGKGKRGQSPGLAMDISFDRFVSSRVGKPFVSTSWGACRWVTLPNPSYYPVDDE
jgi:hypothetical protein